MAKRYQKKSASKKKREKKGGPSRNTIGHTQTHGVMGNMVSGFRRAIGSESSESRSGSLLWTAVLVTAAIAIIAWNFAR
ncbi:MAG: hypothetical protein JRE81_13600 [Deltaproteobacteria bacterium]|nr:hypothetical protein [Deltaproteobacteria bacterium]